jgi:hypothetical protein
MTLGVRRRRRDRLDVYVRHERANLICAAEPKLTPLPGRVGIKCRASDLALNCRSGYCQAALININCET